MEGRYLVEGIPFRGKRWKEGDAVHGSVDFIGRAKWFSSKC